MINNTSQPNQSRTLWIGDIESWMDEKFLVKIFSELTTVKNVKIMRDKNTGLNQGYGFVEFESPEIAKTIMTNLNGKSIAGTNKLFKLNWATHGAGKTTAYNTNNSQLNGFQGGNNTQQDYSIYVADIDPNVTEEILKEFFMKLYPSVISSKIIVDPITKVSKGYGFIKFKDYNESQRAISEMNGKLFFSKPLKTNQAAWKKVSQENTNSNSNYAALYAASNPNANSYYQKGLINSSSKLYSGYTASTDPNTAMYGGYDMNQVMMMYGQMNGNNANFQNYQHVYNPVHSGNQSLSTLPTNNNINSNPNNNMNMNMNQYLQYQQLYLQSLYQNYNLQGGKQIAANNYTNNMQTLSNPNNVNSSTGVGNQSNSQQFFTYLGNVNGYNTLNNNNSISPTSVNSNLVNNNNNNYLISKQESSIKIEEKEDDDEKSENSEKSKNSNRSNESEKSESSKKSDEKENNNKNNERKEISPEKKKGEMSENSEDYRKRVNSVSNNDPNNQIEKNCVTTK